MKKMKEYAAGMVDRHCGRLRYDFVQRIDKTQIGFKAQLRHSTQSLTQQITQAIQLGQSLAGKTGPETKRLQDELETRSQKLADIKVQLQSI